MEQPLQAYWKVGRDSLFFLADQDFSYTKKLLTKQPPTKQEEWGPAENCFLGRSWPCIPSQEKFLADYPALPLFPL